MEALFLVMLEGEIISVVFSDAGVAVVSGGADLNGTLLTSLSSSSSVRGAKKQGRQAELPSPAICNTCRIDFSDSCRALSSLTSLLV